MPKYSIVMPVYGVEDFLCNAIQSVLNQTILDYELILVDDESPDNCPQICDDYASKYSQIKVVQSLVYKTSKRLYYIVNGGSFGGVKCNYTICLHVASFNKQWEVAA